LSAVARGDIGPRDTVVCVITGTGFKDMAAIERMTAADTCPTVEWDALA
jgi:threonine synthase